MPGSVQMTKRRTQSVLLAAASCIISVGAVVGGCASRDGVSSHATKRLTLDDFAPEADAGPATANQATPSRPVDVNAPGRPREAFDVTGPVAAAEGVGDVTARPGQPPPTDDARPSLVGRAVLVDAKVGEINGKPVYASTFFDTGTPALQEPLGRRLALAAGRMPAEQWLREAAGAISDRLDEIVRDELLRAEALANIPDEKRQGLFSYLETLQEDARRRSGGSREALKRQVAAEDEGMTPEQLAKVREQSLLVYIELSTKVERRVNVTSRDIAQAYNGKFFDRYHHVPRYRFRVLQTPEGATEDRRQIEDALAAGTPVAEIATLPANRHNRDADPAKAGLEVREVRDDAARGELFPNTVLNEAAGRVRQGETVGPLTVGPTVYWVHLEGVDYPLELYDAQLTIADALKRERTELEQRRYVQRLLGRASVTSIPQMRASLLRIAAERYLPNPPPRS